MLKIHRYHTTTFCLALSMHTAPAHADLGNWLTTSLIAREEEQCTYEYTMRPKATVNIAIITGNITIESWGKPHVMVQLTKHARTREELLPNPLEIIHDQQSLKIHAIPTYKHIITNITLMVPGTATVTVNIEEQGDCNIPAAPRNLTIHTQSGEITAVTHLDGNINATTENGSIYLTCEAFSTISSVMLAAPRGSITLGLPTFVQARVEAHSQRGAVLSQFPITFDPFTAKLDKNSWKQLQKKVKGTIGMSGEGEAPITLNARNTIAIKAGDAS